MNISLKNPTIGKGKGTLRILKKTFENPRIEKKNPPFGLQKNSLKKPAKSRSYAEERDLKNPRCGLRKGTSKILFFPGQWCLKNSEKNPLSGQDKGVLKILKKSTFDPRRGRREGTSKFSKKQLWPGNRGIKISVTNPAFGHGG